MRTYSEALAYLNQFINYERAQPQRYAPETLSLDRVNRLLERLGRPEQAYPTIHIAGTKGKGSTAAMIESSLRTAGYRTGLYTSPHLHTFRERMRVDNELITREHFAQLAAELEPQVAAVEGLTWFEIVTTLAFVFFAQSKVEVAVLEVGLGGRFDATNVVIPLVSVITSLSLDHVNLLGNTIEQIAFEKAGIIKRRVPVVSAPQVPEAAEVIRRVARMCAAPLTLVPQPPPLLASQSPEKRPPLPLLGAHQLINASVAVTALQLARQRGLRVGDDAILRGLATVQWPGRLEVLSHDPLLVVDGAHNGDSARQLAQALHDVFQIEQWTLIIGISADKDIPAILEALLPRAEQVIVTRAANQRATNIEELGAQVADRGYAPTLTANVADALEIALQGQTPIIVTGSLFTVADAREAWFRRIGVSLDKDE